MDHSPNFIVSRSLTCGIPAILGSQFPGNLKNGIPTLPATITHRVPVLPPLLLPCLHRDPTLPTVLVLMNHSLPFKV